MSKLRWLGILMGIAILGITGFQVYWVKQNYAREEATLAIKADRAFRETIMDLQAAKLKLNGIKWTHHDSANGRVKIMMKNPGETMMEGYSPNREMISSINIIKEKLKDSIQVRTDVKSGVVIAMDKSSFVFDQDSEKFNKAIPLPGLQREDYIVNLLYQVDSLQDSLRVSEIDSACSKTLKQRNIDVPFTITKSLKASFNETTQQKATVRVANEFSLNQVTVGFAHPVSYQLKLGNTFSYLVKRIAQPILFSVLLLGITILSFLLLYRNLVKQRRLTELKNEFISNITHELKTPIATVGVAVEALKNFNALHDPAETKEYLSISQNELHRLNLLVDKVLKLSMFEKQEVELKKETLDLQELVTEVVNSLKLQLDKYHASVSVTAEGDLHLQGDRMHLQSVVFNLLDNAIKYSKEKPVIGISLKEQEGNIVLTVADNGIGIASEYKNKIFEKFFRVPHGDTHNAKGYGLGLSYVAQVVQKHNGTISVDSQPGLETRFTIILPKNNLAQRT